MKRYKVEIVCNGYCCLMTEDRNEAIEMAKAAKRDDIRAKVWDYATSMTIYRNWIPNFTN